MKIVITNATEFDDQIRKIYKNVPLTVDVTDEGSTAYYIKETGEYVGSYQNVGDSCKYDII